MTACKKKSIRTFDITYNSYTTLLTDQAVSYIKGTICEYFALFSHSLSLVLSPEVRVTLALNSFILISLPLLWGIGSEMSYHRERIFQVKNKLE